MVGMMPRLDRENALRLALGRLLLEFDFLIESGIVVDCRDDFVFQSAYQLAPSYEEDHGLDKLNPHNKWIKYESSSS